ELEEVFVGRLGVGGNSAAELVRIEGVDGGGRDPHLGQYLSTRPLRTHRVPSTALCECRSMDRDCPIHTARSAVRQRETPARDPVALGRPVWYQEQVSDLSPDRVRALADALGLPLSAEDLDEVTHRLNAVLDALAPLGSLPLDSVEPVPAWPWPDPQR